MLREIPAQEHNSSRDPSLLGSKIGDPRSCWDPSQPAGWQGGRTEKCRFQKKKKF